jgi:uncharacterized protein YyaL (SSP411 family)
LLTELSRHYVPALVLAGGMPDAAAEIALLKDRPMIGGKATAYVCRGFVCDAPVTDVAALREQLTRGARAQ